MRVTTVRILAPIAAEILFVELAEQKDWSGKRERSLYVNNCFASKKY